ncbi:MAG TPA: RidA family protein [Candidatus Methylomirabilis sp.]|nr:RidA family protein [Candidatus Methylomirabilis sp.]
MATNVNPPVDIGIASQIGKYSDAIEITRRARWLFTSGTPGLTPDGHLPATFELQAEQAWKNILLILQRGGMGPENLVKIVQYLARSEDLAAYAPIRARFLGDCRPASMLLVAAALPRPDFLIEIEATAAAPE